MMKIFAAFKRICVNAAAAFTVMVYFLYLFRSFVPGQSSVVLPMSYLNAFLLFGAILGLTGVLLDHFELTKVLRRTVHFFATAAGLFIALAIAGYFSVDDSLPGALPVPNRILYCLIIYIVIYFVCVGVAALVKKIFSLITGKKNDSYTSVLSK